MSVVVIGRQHKQAPLSLLEAVAVGDADLHKVLAALSHRRNLQETVVLSTCLRTEVYAVVERFHDGVAELQEFLATISGTPVEVLADHLSVRFDDDVTTHLFTVAAGLDSAVLGESEVLGQVRRAWERAQLEQVSGPVLGALFRHAVETGKRVRSETAIARGITSLSHGAVALAFGDDTAKRAGRLTLNPIKHVDPVGTLLVPAVLSLSGIGAYGWAKPVPVSTNRLRSPRNHTVVVSLVGPLTNFALSALLGVIFVATASPLNRAAVAAGYYPISLISMILFLAGVANIVLGVFNCIPCPPLDGAAVLERFLPARHVIVAAGAIETPRLLLLSGL